MSDELKSGEPHPASYSAREYIANIPLDKLMLILESYSSCAIEGNRIAEICSGTLERLLDSKPVGDRYVLGLAWSIRNMKESGDKQDAEER